MGEAPPREDRFEEAADLGSQSSSVAPGNITGSILLSLRCLGCPVWDTQELFFFFFFLARSGSALSGIISTWA